MYNYFDCLASYMFEKEHILLSDTTKNTEQYTYDDHSIDDQGWLKLSFDNRALAVTKVYTHSV